MNSDRNNKKLDKLISQTISRDTPQFDFDKWKQSHQKEIQIYESQEKSTKTTSTTFEPNIILRIMPWKKAGCLAAACLIIFSLVACFVLSKKVADLNDELEQARREPPPAATDDSATINLYIQEHQDVVARHASMSPAAPQSAQMRVSRDDILYYEFLDGGPEFMSPGIIVRGPSFQRQISQSEAPAISNGHTLTLSQARKAADFGLHAPPRLFPGYSLHQIRRIEDCDALQLLYTDNINSVSLFEQSLDGQHGLSPQDFREYAVYQNKGQAVVTILAWRDDTLSYVLIGNIEMSQLMDMARAISVGK